MDNLENESLTELRITNANEDNNPAKLTCRQKATKFAIKGNEIKLISSTLYCDFSEA